MMKRKIAYVLAAVLTFSSILPAYAADSSGENIEKAVVSQQPETEATASDGEKKEEKLPTESQEHNSPDKEQADREEISVSPSKKNVVRVSMATAYDLAKPESYQMKLQGNGTEQTKELNLSLDSEETDTYVAFEVEPGDYTLEVSNPKYLAYTQEFSVEAEYNYSVTLINGWLAGYTYQKGAVHPGVIKRGDVNQDKSLDDKDADLIIKAIEEKAEIDSECNLNSDDKVSLADLQCLAENLYHEGDNMSSVEKTMSERILSVELDSADQDRIEIVDGKLGDVLKVSSDGIKLKWKEDTLISEENPIKVAFPVAENKSKDMGGLILTGNKDNLITGGIIEVEAETENGGTETIQIPIQNPETAMFAMLRSAGPSAKWENGVLVVDFAGQIAVKKVTIMITGTQSSNLAEISTVEFLNDMEERIPAPQMDIPENLSAAAGDKRFTVSWNPCLNITGYEVEISAETAEGTKVTETKKTAHTSLEVALFNGDELVNKTVYTIRVQSVNGEWKSGYSEEVTVIPFTTNKPPAPDNLTLKGGYRTITAGWKKMEDTDSYNLFYKKEGDAEFTKISDILANSYQITELEDLTSYEVYVTGVNDNGEGPQSLHSKISTINIIEAKLPQYRLINTSSGQGSLSSHIVSAAIQGSDVRSMVDSPLDAENAKSALGVFDNLYTSYYNILDWDDGCSYYASNKGLTVTLDQSYHIGYISFAQAVEQNNISGARVFADGKEVTGVSLVKRTDENGRAWYLIKFPNEGIQAEKLQICIKSYNRNLSIAEMRFHEYDSLEQDIYNLFSDDLYTTLKESVTQHDLDALQARLDTEINGEYHIDREMLQKELDNAKSIFAQEGLGSIVNINTNITAKKDGGKGFGGLNPWQPIGVCAYADENVVIYVGSNKGKTGDATDLYLYATQYHSESGEFVAQAARLKVGRNEVSIPGLTDRNFEKGGSLYVAYNGNNQNDQYAVRVSGGTDIPVLNLYKVEEGSEEWNTRITAYVEALEKKVPELADIHNTVHKGVCAAVDYEYDKTNCIAGATEIMLNQMMYSVSSEQILAGLGTGTVQQKAEKLSSSLTAMNQMMTLYYQHKGLNDEAEAQVDKLPSQHLNIRYHRMFAGAFMYAGGNHIGIEWDSVKGLATGQKLVEENGKYVSGQMFGWGIGHEIGHDINQGTYAVAEITNNYFAQLSTRGAEVNNTARFDYQSVYNHVTSGSVGRSSNLRIALAMYWQLHLAYDRGYNYKVYDNYEEQLANLFYARVDTYSRTPSKAPAGKNGIALNLNGDVEQNFIRLASAAAEKDLTDFFVHWGMIPNEETAAYISQFAPETRAIYYVNDESRVYEIENGTEATIKEQDILNDMQAVVDANVKNDVKIKLGHHAEPNVILGYEIIRCITSGGEVQEQVVGFTTESEFTDHITAVNNRVITYKIYAVDHFMNRSAVKILEPVKIEHEGDHGKALWEVELNNITPKENKKTDNTEDYPDEEIVEDGTSYIIDNDAATVFEGTADADVKKEVSVVLDFHQSLTVTGIRYRAGGAGSVGSYKVYISEDKTNWKEVSKGELNALKQDQKIYFQEGEDSWICSYNAVYLKFVIEGRNGLEITIPEIDVLGPTGDNVDFRSADGQPVIGILKNDYVVDSAKNEKIPKGSLVFIGKYKGNPAYNVGILYDENGKVVGGTNEAGELKAEQVILADVPEQGELGETYDGTWIYWIAPENLDKNNLPAKVRAELYRVNNALTNEGQRLVSDSMFYDVPAVLPEIELTNQ